MHLLSIAVAFVAVFGAAVHLYGAAVIHQPALKTTVNAEPFHVVNVIVAGATGDLAAKYLWVALFRLALEEQTLYKRTLDRYVFDKEFTERVCGDTGSEASTAQTKCRQFLETGFKPNSCEMIHRHSAHELATHLRERYKSDELYVMDHYAGKPVVHALRNYFHINAAALHPI
eukprot:jgi/Phyca11/20239/fgenesh1_pg.PHYCAscaffold_60_\